ncbi:ATP-dependent DNA ligase [Sphingosinicella rhizophila]|uniref:DNA ligase (ATP) n=1 Tax=Sphingosinicella rhizophila TaxID=3050082 RepID=A0ABU3Q4P3_9SPHN|nr:ATP-dependent DNA ligase [Sphingosinicella sp. GR2756]MDT9598272.1 ATP-dependent DNA ligase [Sphingosinicella sp. GR2756]
MGAFDRLPAKPGLPPMEARLVDALPDEAEWQFEPKWDGFRCLVFRDGEAVDLRSKSGKPLGRYFPEVVTSLLATKEKRFVLDGELIIPVGGILSFEALQLRLHPAESRIRRLAAESPAQIMLFDCLAAGPASYLETPLSKRRQALERLHSNERTGGLLLSPRTVDRHLAQSWLEGTGGALDGIVAKRLDEPYRPGERAMLKIKQRRSADCVVGGFRYGTARQEVGSLLLGLYDACGKLNHVGFTSAIPTARRRGLTRKLEALIEPPGFTGKAPGGPSRWSTDRSADWRPLRPELVVEIRYDHVTGDRFRHGTKFLRWRPDKAPDQCGMEQLRLEAGPSELAATLKETQ